MFLSLLTFLYVLAAVLEADAYGYVPEPCSHDELGELRLEYTEPVGNNTLEVCRSVTNYTGTYNVWSRVCGYGWDCREATVACRNLQDSGHSRAVPSVGYDWYYYYSNSLRLIQYTCNGNETSLSRCSSYISYYCHYVARLVCIPYEFDSCPKEQHGKVRLVGGKASDIGRLELCFEGDWSPFLTNSGFGYNEGATACKQLGFLEYPKIFTGGQFDHTRNESIYSRFTNIKCYGSEKKLSDCNIYNKSSSCEVTRIPEQIGLQCFKAPSTQCTHGSARLVGGRIEQEGRVEVCINGVWGSVCRAQLKISDVYVLCSQLGYHGPSDRFIDSGVFGSGDGPILRGFACKGWEQNIGQCFNSTLLHQDQHNLHCNSDSAAAVHCSDFCRTGDVKLVGGPNSNSGIVEYCQDNLWGLIAEPGWSNTDAAVVCKQLGFRLGGAVAVQNATRMYKRPNKLVYLANVFCTGKEKTLLQCASIQRFKLSNNNTPVSTDYAQGWVEVAGVMCQTALPTPGAQNVMMTASESSTVTAIFMGLVFLMLLLLLASAAVVLVVQCIQRKKIDRLAWQHVPTDDI